MADNTFQYVTRTECPICSGRELSDLYAAPFSDSPVFEFLSDFYHGRLSRSFLGEGRYVICHCRPCDFYFQREVLNDEGMFLLYEEIISKEESLAKREGAQAHYFDSLLRNADYVRELTPNIRPREIRVMDFGMGWGHWAVAAKAKGFSVCGAELSPSRISFAQRSGIEVVDVDALPDSSIDFVHSDQVFEHVPDPLSLMTTLRRLLKPGGVLQFFVPGTEGLKRKISQGLRPQKDEVHPLEHVNAYTPTSIRRLAERTGFGLVTRRDWRSIRAQARWALTGQKRLKEGRAYLRRL